MNNVRLVTGSASGLGRNIAEAALESGDRLVATARDTKRLDDLVKKYGDHVRAVPLDVTDECAAQAAVQTSAIALYRTDLNGPGANQKSPELLDSTMVSEVQAWQSRPELPLTVRARHHRY